MPYRRVSDGTMVADSEALDATGALRSGYAASMGMLQPGQHIGFDIMMTDTGKSVRSRTFYDTAAVSLSDAERTFADSVEGRAAIAYERYKHRLSDAHRGANARPWNDAMQAEAVRKLTAQQVSDRTQAAATLADFQRRAPAEQAASDTAYNQMVDRLHNGWRN
jgi:hypothetical protein